MVLRLLADFDDDMQLLSQLVTEFNHYLRQHAHRIHLAEKRSAQAAQGENKLKEIRLKVDRYLRQTIANIQLPKHIQALLFEAWANFLSFNLLRFGSRSAHWREAAQVVDDILWYCQAHNTHTDTHARMRIDELQTSLPKLLQHGLDTVGYDNTQGKRLIKALVDLQHPHAAQQRPHPPRAPTATDIDQLEAFDSAQSAQLKDPLIQLLATTALETWFSFNCKAKNSQQLKLAWSNPDTLHFMFVNRLGRQVAIKTGQQLATEIRSGDTKILKKLDNKPFFEAAMEQVVEQLKHREQTQHSS